MEDNGKGTVSIHGSGDRSNFSITTVWSGLAVSRCGSWIPGLAELGGIGCRWFAVQCPLGTVLTMVVEVEVHFLVRVEPDRAGTRCLTTSQMVSGTWKETEASTRACLDID